MKLTIYLAVLLLALVACSPVDNGPPPTATPPAALIAAIDDLLVAGSKLNAATGQGVSYLNYRDYYAEVGGAFDLALASWPDEFAPDAKLELLQAMLGWDLAGYMWAAQLDKKLTLQYDPRQDEFIQYGGDALRTVAGSTGETVQIRDENIGALLSLASAHFETGRDLLLPLMP